jgi:uncharacterized protein involved in exopolysaccharide biosynthesis
MIDEQGARGAAGGPGGAGLRELAIVLGGHLKLLLLGPLLVGLAALGITFLITPSFTARTVFLPPQPQQSSALSALGPLSGLLGLSAQRTPADQYVALLQSTSVTDRLIDKFELLKVYDEELRFEARKELARNTRATAGKKDGLIVLEVDDESPQRAAEIANAYVEELRLLTNRLALTEAKQRRQFFEGLLEREREKLAQAQQALLSSGFNAESIKAEPKAAAEGYARLAAQITTNEARLDALRQNLTDRAAEVRQLEAVLAVLRAQLARIETTAGPGGTPDYVGKYRDFKYHETLFEQLARQYELARVDESREGQLQVVDVAQPPEKKSWPKRGLISLGSTLATFIVLLAWVLGSRRWPEAGRTGP